MYAWANASRQDLSKHFGMGAGQEMGAQPRRPGRDCDGRFPHNMAPASLARLAAAVAALVLALGSRPAAGICGGRTVIDAAAGRAVVTYFDGKLPVAGRSRSAASWRAKVPRPAPLGPPPGLSGRRPGRRPSCSAPWPACPGSAPPSGRLRSPCHEPARPGDRPQSDPLRLVRLRWSCAGRYGAAGAAVQRLPLAVRPPDLSQSTRCTSACARTRPPLPCHSPVRHHHITLSFSPSCAWRALPPTNLRRRPRRELGGGLGRYHLVGAARHALWRISREHQLRVAHQRSVPSSLAVCPRRGIGSSMPCLPSPSARITSPHLPPSPPLPPTTH